MHRQKKTSFASAAYSTSLEVDASIQQASNVVNVSWFESLPKTGEPHFVQGVNFPSFRQRYVQEFELQLPHDETPPKTEMVDGPKFISTLNSIESRQS